jgi:exopolyphosphatase/guanosine-5'-triphosphate,3'-diphosphate pyrophosphatase
MDAIDLRWEWRTFGTDFGDAEARVMSGALPRRDSAELYIVSDHSDANTKIRGHRLEVKTLQQVDARGLELWQPTLSSTFPLAAAPLEAVYRAWAITPPPAGHAAWTLATFLDDVLQKDHSLTLINVTKSRRNTVVDDCLVEIADATFDGMPARSIAVEHSDGDCVWRVVNALGLAGRENMSYVKALQRFIAMRDRAA